MMIITSFLINSENEGFNNNININNNNPNFRHIYFENFNEKYNHISVIDNN